MKTGIVLEGGAMRGMYTAGVIDVLMENDITFDGAIGVSAGAVFGCNLKSKQIGRVIRYNVRFCREWRFCSWRSLIFTGDLYGADFCYNQLPYKLDKFDTDTYVSNPMEFYVVCTDIETGEPVYKRLDKGDEKAMLYYRASASMPLVSRPVDVDGRKLLDGGMSDSIPLKYFESIGYDRNVVVLTQPDTYKKHHQKHMKLISLVLNKYPELVKKLDSRYYRYNNQVKYVKEREATGEVFVIRPPESLNISSVEHNKDELLRVYEIGRKTMESQLEELRLFLAKEV